MEWKSLHEAAINSALRYKPVHQDDFKSSDSSSSISWSSV